MFFFFNLYNIVMIWRGGLRQFITVRLSLYKGGQVAWGTPLCVFNQILNGYLILTRSNRGILTGHLGGQVVITCVCLVELTSHGGYIGAVDNGHRHLNHGQVT